MNSHVEKTSLRGLSFVTRALTKHFPLRQPRMHGTVPGISMLKVTYIAFLPDSDALFELPYAVLMHWGATM